MTLALFPAFAPPPPPCSVHTSALSTYQNDMGGNRPAAEVPAAGRPRRRVALRPALPRLPRADDAKRHADRQRLHEYGRSLAIDVVNAALRSDALLEGPSPLTEEKRTWLYRLVGDMTACSKAQAFRHALCGKYHLRPVSCHSRVCPACESLRAGDLRGRILAILDTVPARRRGYAVFTLRNVFDLAAGYKTLAASFKRLRDRPIVKGGKCRQRDRKGEPFHPCSGGDKAGRNRCSLWEAGRHRADRNCPDFRHDPVLGGVAIDEVTLHECNKRVFNRKTKTWKVVRCEDPCPWVGSWHPHLNVLWDAPWILQAELADAWIEVTCPEHHGRCPRGCTLGSFIVDTQQVDPGTVMEAVKYVTKPAALVDGDDPWPMVTFLLATRGRRLVRGFGSFFNVEFEKAEVDQVEQVTLLGELIAVAPGGVKVHRKYRLPRFPKCCGRDSLLADGAVAYDLPFLVPRSEIGLENGVAVWSP